MQLNKLGKVVLLLVLCSVSAFADDQCKKYGVFDLNKNQTKYFELCRSDLQLNISEIDGPKSPQRNSEEQSKKHQDMNNIENFFREPDIQSELSKQAINFFKSQSEPPQQKTPSEYELNKRDVVWNQFLMMVSSWAAVGLLGVTIWLLNKNRQQLDTANKSTADAAGAGIEAANAAIRAAKAAENAERPYVLVSFDLEFIEASPGERWKYRIIPKIQNFGKAPAVDLRCEFGELEKGTSESVFNLHDDRCSKFAAPALASDGEAVRINIDNSMELEYRLIDYKRTDWAAPDIGVCWSYKDPITGSLWEHRVAGALEVVAPNILDQADFYRDTEQGYFSDRPLQGDAALKVYDVFRRKSLSYRVRLFAASNKKDGKEQT